MIAPLRSGLMVGPTTVRRFRCLNLKTYLTKLKMNLLLCSILEKISELNKTSHAIHWAVQHLYFRCWKKSLWDKNQVCRLPGNFWGARKKKGGGSETKNHFSDALSSFWWLASAACFFKTNIAKCSIIVFSNPVWEFFSIGIDNASSGLENSKFSQGHRDVIDGVYMSQTDDTDKF